MGYKLVQVGTKILKIGLNFQMIENLDLYGHYGCSFIWFIAYVALELCWGNVFY